MDFSQRINQLQIDNPDRLLMVTIYDRPRDFPKHFIARASLTGRKGIEQTGYFIRANTLEALQAKMSKFGLYWVGRHEQDEPHIVGGWI